ncbi:MAG: SOS response-associated peptidase [Candidatus Micrarchaeota archaeon]
MCGRFSLTVPIRKLQEHYEARRVSEEAAKWKPSYNIAPAQLAPVVVRQTGDETATEIILARWGFVPAWAEDAAAGGRMINARAESVAEKPAFRKAFNAGRCLVPFTSFFEWRKTAGSAHKTPFAVGFGDRRIASFAGVTEENAKLGVRTFTIVTTEPNAVVKPIHERMPVILDAAGAGKWLDPETDAVQASSLLKPFPAVGMLAWEASPRVNSPAFNAPEAMLPARSRQETLG